MEQIMELNDSERKTTDGEIVTCVYCGHEYPGGIPAAKHELLTKHIKVCEKHSMRNTERKAKLFDAVENAARDLPDGWKIYLCVEGGYAGIEVITPYGHTENIDSDNRPLDQQITDAVNDVMKADFELQNSEPITKVIPVRHQG